LLVGLDSLVLFSAGCVFDRLFQITFKPVHNDPAEVWRH
jgi:hypothetical protein